MNKRLQTPAHFHLHNTHVVEGVHVTFEGRAIPTKFRDRVKLAWNVLRNRVPALYKAETIISGCLIEGHGLSIGD